MPETGVKTDDLDQIALVDEVVGNKDGSTGRQSFAALSQQLLASGALAAALSSITPYASVAGLAAETRTFPAGTILRAGIYEFEAVASHESTGTWELDGGQIVKVLDHDNNISPEQFNLPLPMLGNDTAAYDAAQKHCVANPQYTLKHRRFYLVDQVNIQGSITIRMGRGRGIGPRGYNISLLIQPLSLVPPGTLNPELHPDWGKAPAIPYLKIHDLEVKGMLRGQWDAGAVQVNGVTNTNITIGLITDCGDPLEAAPAHIPTAGMNGLSISQFEFPDGPRSQNVFISGGISTACTKASINITTRCRVVSIVGHVAQGNISNATNAQAPGIQVNGGQRVEIIGNTCQGNQGAGLIIASVGTVPGIDARELIITGNQIYNNGRAGIYGLNGYSSATGYAIIANNQIWNNGLGNTLGGSWPAPRTVIPPGEPGILLQDWSRAHVHDNDIYDTMGHGVFFDGVEEGRIEDNNIYNAGRETAGVYSGVRLRNSTGIKIKGNTIKDTRGTKRHRSAVYFDVGNSDIEFSGNKISGWTDDPFEFHADGVPGLTMDQKFPFSTPASGSYTLLPLIPLPDDCAGSLDVAIIGKAATTSCNMRSVFGCNDNGGTPTGHGAATVLYAQQTAANFALALDVNAGQMRTRAMSGGESAEYRVRMKAETVAA